MMKTNLKCKWMTMTLKVTILLNGCNANKTKRPKKAKRKKKRRRKSKMTIWIYYSRIKLQAKTKKKLKKIGILTLFSTSVLTLQVLPFAQLWSSTLRSKRDIMTASRGKNIQLINSRGNRFNLRINYIHRRWKLG